MRSNYLGKALSTEPPPRRIRALWLVPVSLLLGVGAAAFLSLHGLPQQFRIWEANRIEISGNRILLQSEVQDQARLGIHPSWLFLDASGVRSRLLQHPWVSAAQVSRGPWRQVRIRIEERAPEAILPHRGRLAELDPDGVILPLGGGRVAGDLPSITGLDLDSVGYGRRVAEPRVAACVEFLARCRETHKDLWRRISELRLTDPGVIRMVLQDLPAEVWLRPEGLNERKLALLDTVLPDLEKRAPGVRVVDMRFRDQIVLKTDGGAAKAPSKES